MNEVINMVGEVEILLNNEVVLEKKNLIVQVGKNFLASAVINSSTSPFVAMAIGTGTTAANTADTALETEVARAAFSSSSVADNVVSLSNTYAAGTGTGAITEAGILNNASTGGVLLSHVVFGAVNKGSLDTLTINWTITVG
jgi:hypothetical protein